MPTYEYKCTKCTETETVFRGITEEDPGMVCKCGEPMVKKFGVGGINFVGSGFYSKDK